MELWVALVHPPAPVCTSYEDILAQETPGTRAGEACWAEVVKSKRERQTTRQKEGIESRASSRRSEQMYARTDEHAATLRGWVYKLIAPSPA